jgi:hypothetical protein
MDAVRLRSREDSSEGGQGWPVELARRVLAVRSEAALSRTAKRRMHAP